MTAKHLIYQQQTANSSNFLKHPLDGYSFDAVACCDALLTDRDAAFMVIINVSGLYAC